MPKPIADEERRHPGGADPARPEQVAARRAVLRRRGDACASMVGGDGCHVRVVSPLLARLDQILDERVELRLRQASRTAASRSSGSPSRTYAFGSTIDSRMNVLERLAGALRVLRQLVEVGADLAASRRPRSACGTSRTALFLKTAAPDDRRCSATPSPSSGSFSHLSKAACVITIACDAHHRVAEPAELGADHRVGADLGRRDVELRVDARHRVLLLPELRHPERVDDVLRL